MNFGAGVRCREITIAGVPCKVYAEQEHIAAIDLAVSCIDAPPGQQNVVDIFGTVLRGVYAHLGMDIPSEFDPEVELQALLGMIDGTGVGAHSPSVDVLQSIIDESKRGE